jgi:hypothetical protein
MVELVKEEDIIVAKKNEELEKERMNALEAAKELRERKKQEALERSRQRQADPNYFKKIADLNVKEVPKLDSANDISESNEDCLKESSAAVDDDPFRTVPSTRSKIYIK